MKKQNLALIVSISLLLVSCSKDKFEKVICPKKLNLVVGQTCCLSIHADCYDSQYESNFSAYAEVSPSVYVGTNDTCYWVSDNPEIACAYQSSERISITNGTCVTNGVSYIKAHSSGECTIYAHYYKNRNLKGTVPVLVTVTDQGYTTYNPNDTVFIKVDEIKNIEFEASNQCGFLLQWVNLDNEEGGCSGIMEGISSYPIDPDEPFSVSMYHYNIPIKGGQEGNVHFRASDTDYNIDVMIPIKVLPKED